MTWGDFDGDGKTEYTFNVTVPETGFLYVNMHLDFGLEKQSGWLKSEAGGLVDYEDAKDNPVVTSSDPAVLPTILEGTEYVFSSNLVGSEDSIFNNNVFKNLKGNGGFVHATNGTADESDDLLLSNVLVKVVEKAKPGTTLWQGNTDADGWFYANFGPTGKKITYTVTADTNGDGKLNGLDKSMDFDLGGPVKFAVTDFFGDWPAFIETCCDGRGRAAQRSPASRKPHTAGPEPAVFLTPRTAQTTPCTSLPWRVSYPISQTHLPRMER